MSMAHFTCYFMALAHGTLACNKIEEPSKCWLTISIFNYLAPKQPGILLSLPACDW